MTSGKLNKDTFCNIMWFEIRSLEEDLYIHFLQFLVRFSEVGSFSFKKFVTILRRNLLNLSMRREVHICLLKIDVHQ